MEAECDKHSDCMERIHENINSIKLTNAITQGEIAAVTKNIKDFLDSVRTDIYSKGGIMERVGKHDNQLNLQWGMIGAVVIAIIVAVIGRFFKK